MKGATIVRVGTVLFGPRDWLRTMHRHESQPNLRLAGRREHGPRTDQRPAALGNAPGTARALAKRWPRRARSSPREFGVSATADNARAIAGANDRRAGREAAARSRGARASGAGARAGRPLLISVCAGMRVASLEEWMQRGSRRRARHAQPPCAGRRRHHRVVCPAQLTAAQRARRAERSCRQSARCSGSRARTPWMPSRRLSGSGPAYFFLLAELMAEAAVRAGPRRGHRACASRRQPSTARACSHTPADADLARMRARGDLPKGTTEAARARHGAADLAAIVARAPRGRRGAQP